MGIDVHRYRATRRLIAGLAIAAAAGVAVPSVALPSVAKADQAVPGLPGIEVPDLSNVAIPGLPEITIPAIPQDVHLDAIASIAPAILGAAAGPADIADSPQSFLIQQLTTLRDTPGLPDQIKTIVGAVISFLDGSGGGGPDIPDPNAAPVIQQFLYPTLGKGCISPTADSVATALAVSGPAKLPPPGPGAGQAGIVFTALGTEPLAPVQAAPLTINWLNIDNRQSGVATLDSSARINPDGPATLSTIIDTGPGRVLGVVSGGITTQAADAAPISCTFLPTVGMFVVS